MYSIICFMLYVLLIAHALDDGCFDVIRMYMYIYIYRERERDYSVYVIV